MADEEFDFTTLGESDPYDPRDVARGETKTLSLIEAADATVRQRLERRQQAYVRLFNGHAEDMEIVMQDLTVFCRGDTAVFHENERIHCLLTGRQEVYQRIMDHTRLDLDTLVLKYTQPQE